MTDKDRPKQQNPARLSIALSMIPIIGCGVLTSMLGYDAPYWDQWWKIPLIVKSFDGTIALADY